MKKLFSLFLLIGFVVFAPVSVFAASDNLVKICKGKPEDAKCAVAGAIEPRCEKQGPKKELSCTSKECDEQQGYIHIINMGWCRTRQWVEDQCNKKKCSNGERSTPNIVPNIFGRSGKSFKQGDCICPKEKTVEKYSVTYSCGDDATGTPPTDDNTYTNVADVTAAENNNCLKIGSTFVGWRCGEKIVKVGNQFKISTKTTCVAQWEECPACQPGDGCTCELSVENNECKYKTTPKKNYRILSGNETAEPQCELVTSCPVNATGTYPNCECADAETYNKQSNECVAKCNESVAYWDGASNQCKCLNDENYVDGKCVEETLPEQVLVPQPMSSAQPPVVCQTDEKEVGGKCVKQCPSGATGKYPNCVCTGDYEEYDATQNKCVVDDVKQKQDAYDKARTNENSWANRGLTAVTTAATGIGAMELAQGLSERKADAAAEADMSAYIATMRCEYGNGHSVKFDAQKEIELPGGNSPTLSSYINEYKGLASKLKSIKAELGMKPGIEEEVILDKTNMGLYDDEFIGITEGGLEDEGSIYRATALGSESDKEKIDAEKNKTSNRVKWGAVALAGGAAVGLVGDSLINGKLGDMVKNLKEKLSTSKDKESMGSMLKETLKAYGMKNTDKMDLSGLSISDYRELASKVNWESLKDKLPGQDGSELDAKQLQELLLNN